MSVVPRRIARARDRRKNPVVVLPCGPEEADRIHLAMQRMGIRFNYIADGERKR